LFNSVLDGEKLGRFDRVVGLNNEREHDTLDGVINIGLGGDEFCVNKLYS